jgi:hypothetical protein
MKKYFYFVTEGPQDIALIAKLLRYNKLKQIDEKSLVDPFWHRLIPSTFPHQDRLNQPVPVPRFLESSESSIALQSAIGETRLVKTLQEDFNTIELSAITGLAIILDSDKASPEERFAVIKKEIENLGLGLNLPDKPGMVSTSFPLFGVFIFPDNTSTGTLENLLIECAEENYPNLVQLSREYIDKIDKSQLKSDDLRELRKPAGKNKAIVGGVSNILKPGRTLQVSLQDNNWIDDRTIDLPKIKSLRVFLDRVLDRPPEEL